MLFLPVVALLVLIARHRPDVLIFNVILPGLSGYWIARLLGELVLR